MCGSVCGTPYICECLWMSVCCGSHGSGSCGRTSACARARVVRHPVARKVWAKRPKTYWTKKVDLIIDNKKWAAPATAAGRNYLRAQKRRFTHRKRSEGMRPEHTKPSKAPKHRRPCE